MLFSPAGVGLAGFMAKVYDASILIDLGAPNGPDELPLRPAEGWVGTCFCPALPHIFTSSKNRDNSSGLHNPDVGLHYFLLTSCSSRSTQARCSATIIDFDGA